MKSNLNACKKIIYIDTIKEYLDALFKYPVLICLIMYFLTKDVNYMYLVVCCIIGIIVNKCSDTFFLAAKDGYVDEKDITITK